MNYLPCPAKFFQMFCQHGLNVRKFTPGKAVVLTQLRWSSRTVQIEHCLRAAPDHMYMGWTVIVQIDHYTQFAKSEDRWHLMDCTNKPKRLGLLFWMRKRCLFAAQRNHGINPGCATGGNVTGK